MLREEEGKVIRVYNVSFHGKPKAANEVYIGCYTEGARKLGLLPSPLGNRLALHSSYSPQEAVRGYREWLAAIIDAQEPTSHGLKELRRLHMLYLKHGELKLYCWCSPLEPLTSAEPHICHGQALAAQLERETRAFEAIIVWAFRGNDLIAALTEDDVDKGNLPELTAEEKARIDEIDIEAIIAKGMRLIKENEARERGHAGEAEEA